MVILDEVNVAVHLGLLDIEAVLELMDSKPENVDLILTGRYAHTAIIERADSVVEVKKTKHPVDCPAPRLCTTC